MQPVKSLPKRMLGIDYGMARIGLALSDENQIFATPYKTIQTAKKMEQTIHKLLEVLNEIQQTQKCEIQEVIVGLPLMMNGKQGFSADEVQHFVEQFKIHSLLPIRTWDERLTTVQAERSLRESQMTRKKRTQMVDIVSAAIILQSYLDHRSIRHQSET